MGARFLQRPAARWIPLLAVAVFAAGPAALTSPRSGPLVVHEWGTFVSMEGSDGLALEGMHHDEADLPAFVHSRGRDQLRLHATRSKMETPVIYFYSPVRQQAHVRVDFPEGILTQWFPQVDLAAPRLLQGDAVPPLKGGRLEWDVELTPEGSPGSADRAASPLLPPAPPGHRWNFPRETGSAYVTVNTWDPKARQSEIEREKFLFYRGLGRFIPPLQVHSSAGGRLSLANRGPDALRHLFVLRVEGGRGAYQYLPGLEPGAETKVRIVLDAQVEPLDRLVGPIGQALAGRLVEQGLYADEARAMVNTWSRSYFRTEGIRVLYAVPRAQIDRNLPLQIDPAPQRLARVFVGRVECLTPEQEAQVEGRLRDLASPDAARAAAARDGLIALGRFAEPHLRRALQTSRDPAVRVRAQALLHRDALNELIAAEQTAPGDMNVTARLAALQRRVGLFAEAKARGRNALAQLEASPPPSRNGLFEHVARRKWLRSVAFAREAIGDAGPAAAAYGDWVRFAAGLKGKDCQFCHKQVGVRPLTYTDLRRWWGGEQFRSLAVQAGKVGPLIAVAERRLKAKPRDSEALLTLAYLLPARGDTEAAEHAWTRLGAAPEKLAAR